ncbi:MAG: ergothioneine biosynthesis protein EgtB [Acidimicrobiales bacterium]
MDLRDLVADELTAARHRSLGLLEPLRDEDLKRQISPIMSPLVWDLAHVGNYEELWLLREVAGASPLDASLDSMYDAFRHPRKNRPSLPLLGPVEARRYVGEVRGRVLDTLERVEFGEGPLTSEGFVYGMVIQHEHMHDETMLATLQLMEEAAYHRVAASPPAGRALPEAERLVPGGPFTMGTDEVGWAYDNEHPAHEVDVAPFWIDTVPVTNARYREFVDDGGYQDERWWGDEGWAWRCEYGIEHPQFWRGEARVRFGVVESLPPDEPVQHVSWHEADAYARWAGKRLPTEAEWEKAAAGVDIEHANLGQRHLRPAPVGAYPDGASRFGVEQLIGDVWEWTSSVFGAYPGFTPFPYKEYSEVFFDSGYKVLRGGSWATHPSAVRVTFRNWDFPIRRQIFAGFRCARDA